MPLPLASILDTSAAGPLRLSLRQAVERGEPLILDGSGVERIGQACLQVLTAARGADGDRNPSFVIEHASPALTEMATLAGLRTLVIA